MAWTSSTAVVGVGSNGVMSTTANNARIQGDWSGDYLEIYGANDTVLASGGSDSVGAVLYPERGMNGNYVYIDGDYGSDVILAAAMQGNQYATLTGGHGMDTFGIGCNSDSTINAVLTDFSANSEYLAVFYEGYRDGHFTCYSSDKGLIFRDDAGRLNVTLSGVSDYNSVLNYGMIWLYPRGIRQSSGLSAAQTMWYNGQVKYLNTMMNYGGYLCGVTVTDNAVILNEYHSGGVVTNGVYGLENIVVIDNSQCTEARFLGGNAQDNYIFAGSGGDTLWGGTGNDILVGGAGFDNFIHNGGDGSDVILGSDWLDTVTLYDVTANDVNFFAEAGAVAVLSNSGESVVIQYNGIYSPLIKLADGSTWRHKGDDGTWQNV